MITREIMNITDIFWISEGRTNKLYKFHKPGNIKIESKGKITSTSITL